MATVAEAQSAISAALDTYIAELEQSGSVWEAKPSGAPEGESAWSAREVAEHIAGAGPFFGMGIAQAIGVTGPTPTRVTLADVPSAVAETRRGHGLLFDVVAQIKDDQMSMDIDHPRLGKQTLGGILSIVEHHLGDHANQLKTLRTN